MKIIFDSEEQKKDFLRQLPCPSKFGFDDNCENNSCFNCWENAIECEVVGKS